MKNIKRVLSVILCLLLVLNINVSYYVYAEGNTYAFSLKNFQSDLSAKTITADVCITFNGAENPVNLKGFDFYLQVPDGVTDVQLNNALTPGFSIISSTKVENIATKVEHMSALSMSGLEVNSGSAIAKATFTLDSVTKGNTYNFKFIIGDVGGDDYDISVTTGGTSYTADQQTVDFAYTVPNCTLTKVEAKAPTCTEDGNIEYWKGMDGEVERYFSKEDGSNEILDKNSVIIPATGHTLEKVEAKAETCTKAGNSEYWKCTKCGKLFSDENGENETTLEEVTIDATGHTWGDWEVETPATCTDKGIEKRTCSVCGEVETRDIEINPDNHNIVEVPAEAETCTEDGNIQYWKCSRCDKYFSDALGTTEIEDKNSVIIPAMGHDFNVDLETNKITCKRDGCSFEADMTVGAPTITLTQTDLDKPTFDKDGTATVTVKVGQNEYTNQTLELTGSKLDAPEYEITQETCPTSETKATVTVKTTIGSAVSEVSAPQEVANSELSALSVEGSDYIAPTVGVDGSVNVTVKNGETTIGSQELTLADSKLSRTVTINRTTQDLAFCAEPEGTEDNYTKPSASDPVGFTSSGASGKSVTPSTPEILTQAKFAGNELVLYLRPRNVSVKIDNYSITINGKRFTPTKEYKTSLGAIAAYELRIPLDSTTEDININVDCPLDANGNGKLVKTEDALKVYDLG